MPRLPRALTEWRAALEFAPTVKTALGDATPSLLDPSRNGAGNASLPCHPESIPGYALQEELHRGAQGVGLIAPSTSRAADVAIKFLHSGGRLSEASRRRFDARYSSWFADSTIPASFVYGTPARRRAGITNYVMDYVAGLTLLESSITTKLDLVGALNLSSASVTRSTTTHRAASSTGI
jgi:hypothetical protein